MTMFDPIEGIDFNVIPDTKTDDPQQINSLIKLLNAPYDGIILRIGVLKFKGIDEDKDLAKFELNYEFVHPSMPENVRHTLREDDEFNRYVGSTLMTILSDQLNPQEENAGSFSVRDSDIAIVEEP